MISVNLLGIPISDEQCIGDSLPYINNAFKTLSGNVLQLDRTVDQVAQLEARFDGYLPIVGGTLTGGLQVGTTSVNTGAILRFGRTANSTDIASPSNLPSIYCGSSDAIGNDLYINGNSPYSKIIFGVGQPPIEKLRLTSSGILLNGSAPGGSLEQEADLHLNGSAVIKSSTDLGLILGRHGANAVGTNYDRLEFGLDTNVRIAYIGTANAGIQSARALAFKTAEVERLRITADGFVGIGTTTPAARLHVDGEIRATGDVVAYHSSDIRLKNNVTTIEKALDKVCSIRGCEYEWNTELQKVHEGKSVGVIAQEVEEVLPTAVVTRDNGYKAVKYESLIPLLVEAIKELKAEVSELKAKLG